MSKAGFKFYTLKDRWWLCSLIFCISCNGRLQQKTKIIPEYNEAALLQFIQVSAIRNSDSTRIKLDSLLAVAGSDSSTLHNTVNYLLSFYADPNSALRNESFYDQLLKVQTNSQWYTKAEKQQALRKLHLLHQNDVGSLANDFEYNTPGDKRKKLYDIKAERLLLFFYNPECNACKEMSAALKESAAVSNAVDKKTMTVLAMYTDNDLALWRRHLHEYPSQWLQGRDENEYLYKNDIYNLKAIPTIYLLDSNKKVLLKDCTHIEELEQKLQ